MKKKLLIVLVIVLALAAVAFSSLGGSKATESVSENWTLSSKEIKKIFVSARGQNVEMKVEQSQKDKTMIQLGGKVTKDTKKKLKDVSLKKDEISIPLSDDGFKALTLSDQENPLKVTISLGKDVKAKEIALDVDLGNAIVQVPKDFNGIFETKITQDGKIEKVPETTKETDDKLSVNVSNGNITIDKE
ncbi:hypothetical protein SAMN02745116_02509 [Pilibacter termitis]|uniref:Adhesin n=1 Tax=Pilibacter termitis TaxID=263852 RepID=A0A1T4RA95_9ENTE|nr:hypothetical protein [Pilibacter termitis]SKA12893.1 hypothetical protein SAMN02745116_02509 [Pilibacter termitis]